MNHTEHDLVPSDPKDGDTFTCAGCGHSETFVVLDDGRPGEWVSGPDVQQASQTADVPGTVVPR